MAASLEDRAASRRNSRYKQHKRQRHEQARTNRGGVGEQAHEGRAAAPDDGHHQPGDIDGPLGHVVDEDRENQGEDIGAAESGQDDADEPAVGS